MSINNPINHVEKIWLPVVGYEGLYEVSNYGDIFSNGRITVSSNGVVKNIKPKMMNPSPSAKKENDDKGYLSSTLTARDGSRRTCFIHKLVAEAFIPNPQSKKTVNHIDGDKHNNHVSNLEWNTYQENNQHAADYGIKRDLKPVAMIDSNGEILKVFASIHDAGDYVNGSFGNIHSVCNGTRQTANGYGWKYVKQNTRREYSIWEEEK